MALKSLLVGIRRVSGKMTDAKKILIVEDEAAIRDLVRFALEQEDFFVFEAHDALQAQRLLAEKLPDLILLDWMLPGMSGIELARRWRADPLLRNIPIIMLTARAEESHRVRGFETGVDDYVIKPFSPKELVARIKAILRRGLLQSPEGVIQSDTLIFDTGRHIVTIGTQPVKLSPTEYRLLHFFVTHPDRVFSREQIIHHVWSGVADIDDRTVDVQMRRLRRALAVYGYEAYIQTVRGSGYRYGRPI